MLNVDRIWHDQVWQVRFHLQPFPWIFPGLSLHPEVSVTFSTTVAATFCCEYWIHSNLHDF